MKNMRQRPRVEINHMISYTCHDGNDEYSATNTGNLINISTNGALIESRQPFTGSFLVLGNNSTTNPRMVKGEIVYDETVITPEGDVCGLYRAGIKFTDLHENAKEFVVSIVQPDASNTPPPGNDESETILDFDVASINEILTDDTPTEDLILIEDLLEENLHEEEQIVDIDVLEDIAKCLKEEPAYHSADNIAVKPEAAVKESPEKLLPEKTGTSNFLPSFNTACLSVICLFCLSLLVLNLTNMLPDFFTILPSDNKLAPTLISDKDEMLMHKNIFSRPEKSASLINTSIKSRFIQLEDNTYQFVINGMINNSSGIKPEDIQVTAKIFSKSDALLGKRSVVAVYKEFDSNTAHKNSSEQLIPFIIRFSNPPEEISRFSLDLSI